MDWNKLHQKSVIFHCWESYQNILFYHKEIYFLYRYPLSDPRPATWAAQIDVLAETAKLFCIHTHRVGRSVGILMFSVYVLNGWPFFLPLFHLFGSHSHILELVNACTILFHMNTSLNNNSLMCIGICVK